jgi:hypothetical protein
VKINLVTHIFFVIGVLFSMVLIHESIHYLQCGGNFIAGFYLINNEAGVGVTYCQRGNASEFLAYSLSSIFTIIVFTIRLKIDRINYER